jgi:S-DNA-T family DNA segregation ATPase FtsK/SpoIIIE
MPRKSNRIPTLEYTTPTSQTPEKLPLMERVRDFFADNRTRAIIAILMLALAVFMLVAYISFLITGAADSSVLDLPLAERIARRGEVHNALGLPGARLSRWLIDGTFGISSILFVMLLVVYALRLLRVMALQEWKLFFCTAFCLVWSSVTLGFIHLMLGEHGFFRLGGAHGQWLATWMNSYVQPLGSMIIILVTMIIFLIVADRHFLPRTQSWWEWLWARITRQKPSEEVMDDIVTDETPDIQVTPDVSVEEENKPSENGDLEVTIEQIPEEPAVEEQPEDEPKTKDSEPEGEDVGLDIEDTQDVELSEQLEPYDPCKDLEHFRFPPLSLLKVYDNETSPVINQEEQQANANRIVTTLRNYDVEIESIRATVGPTVTLYEVVPKAGTRISKIQNLESDIMLSLSATGIRIIAPMPGKGTVGIEVPNENPQTVSMHSVIASKRFQEEQKMRLPIAYGRTITNEVFMFDLAKTPHLLVAGATGTGKSVAINAIITSLLYKKHPAELKLVMVDPKMVEFAPYKPLLKHYLAAMPDADPEQVVITDCDRVINTLNSLVIEMENRYKLLMDAGVRNLEDYNDKFIHRRLNPNKVVADTLHHRYLPYIVIIIDEYGDFIMQAGKQVETPIARITQKARAVGMHMILATQRPSVNIVTGVIKANIPTRIALRTQSVIDSRTVLDAKGAEQLIGRGDSLYAGNASITRVQCAFVDTPEVDEIVGHIAKQQCYTEPYQLPEYVPEGAEGDALAPGSVDMKRLDPMFADVARYVVAKQEGSTSRLQRAFEIGYNRAGKLSDQLEAAGVVGPNKGPKGRDVLITDMDQLDKLLAELGVK